MRCGFRVDASIEIGAGHVMRCLTLADALREHGTECLFICRTHTGHLLELIAGRGHKAIALPPLTEYSAQVSTDSVHAKWLGTGWENDAQDTQRALEAEIVDWLVVDHYALDQRWEQALHASYKKLMVIDDLADRPHMCDLLLDQNLGRIANDYAGLLPSDTTTLIGPKYALLRPEFAQLRNKSLSRRANSQFKHLFISMGGVDSNNATGQVLETLQECPLPNDICITVIMGKHAPWLQQILKQAAQMKSPTKILVDVNDMAQLLADSDLAIGAAGGTAWERCCLGVPSLILVLADNQLAGARALHKEGAAILMKAVLDIEDFFTKNIMSGCMLDMLHKLSHTASQVTDGYGVERIIQKLME